MRWRLWEQEASVKVEVMGMVRNWSVLGVVDMWEELCIRGFRVNFMVNDFFDDPPYPVPLGGGCPSGVYVYIV